MALIFISMLTIYILEDRQSRKICLLYPEIILYILLLLLKRVISIPDGLILLPGSVLAGYAVVLVFTKAGMKTWISGIAGGLCIVIMILLNGNLLQEYSMIVPAENLYHMPEEVRATLDLLKQRNEEVKVIVPKQFLPYMGEYSEQVLTFYEYPADGNEELLSGNAKETFAEMQKHAPSLSYLKQMAEKEGCDYLVLDATYHYPEENPEAEGFSEIGKNGPYIIYRIS